MYDVSDPANLEEDRLGPTSAHRAPLAAHPKKAHQPLNGGRRWSKSADGKRVYFTNLALTRRGTSSSYPDGMKSWMARSTRTRRAG